MVSRLARPLSANAESALEIAEWTRLAIDAGLDVATHAIGDQAVKGALDAYETVLLDRPGLALGRRRIAHFSYASEADIVRAVRLGIALSVQSNFSTRRGTSPMFAEQRVGAANAPRVYAWDRLDRMGALLVEGSDDFGGRAPDCVATTALCRLHRQREGGGRAVWWQQRGASAAIPSTGR